MKRHCVAFCLGLLMLCNLYGCGISAQNEAISPQKGDVNADADNNGITTAYFNGEILKITEDCLYVKPIGEWEWQEVSKVKLLLNGWKEFDSSKWQCGDSIRVPFNSDYMEWGEDEVTLSVIFQIYDWTEQTEEGTIEETGEKEMAEKPTAQITSMPTRIEVNSLLYGEYFDLKDTYHYKPKYNAAQWMNEAGKLLFPYEQDLNNNTTMEGALALLYMPDEVLFKASTEDLLKIVMDGWLETNATSISVYSTPSHYIRSCTIKNQAANELMRRSDMVTVLYEDYCNRNYLKGEESREGRWAADKLQFDEIILASNHAFAMMDDEMKENVLNAALEKHGQVRSGYFYTVGHTSGFFAYIVEEELNGGSDWYQYIHDNNIEAAKNAISFNETCWLEQFY